MEQEELLDEKYFIDDQLHSVRTTMLESFLDSIKEYGSWKGSLADALDMFNDLAADAKDIYDGFETCWNIIKDRLEKNSKLDTWLLLLKDIGVITKEKIKMLFIFQCVLHLEIKQHIGCASLIIQRI